VPELAASPIELTESLLRRFWQRVAKGDGCWEWTGKRDKNGYGRVYLGGGREARREGFAHRVSYTIHFGPIPDGLDVLHHCDAPRCVRPDHFFLGTQTDNMRDMDAKGRRAPRARATECGRGHATSRETTDERGRCLECKRLRDREAKRRRRARDPEGIRRAKREWGARHRDRIAAANAAWYAANRERAIAAERRRRAEKRERQRDSA
jgi:hypothetical protein